MTEDQFDDSLKNKIRDHRSPVPDDIWERIIQKKEKDRKGFLFFFRWFTILLLGICLGGYLLMNHIGRKSEPANLVLTSRDSQEAKAGSLPHLNKEAVGTKENSAIDTRQRVPENSKSYSSQSKRELNLSKEKTSSYSNQRLVSETVAGGAQNLSSERDSLTSGNGDSVANKTGTVNKPPVIVKPAVNSPVDSSQKSIVKKTQKDSSTDKKWYLDIYASPDWPIDHTSYPSSNYLNQQMKLSYTMGLGINRAFGKHFSGKIGIQFSQLNFELKSDTFGLQEIKFHLKSFDFPFLAGYSFGSEKLKMTITAGGTANLSSFTRDSLASIFKTNTGLSLYLGFNLEKKINQKISVYLEPYYRYRLNSMTVNTVDFDKFIDVIGLSFGARIYFLKRQGDK